ncbi:ABC transporter permease [Agreia sp. VKM Ac-1783]|uniref:ABC transporter permease n=1 Tax=Agreia sp. VKM Ac-1783 TaxID=1938889 RepID=UPI000A2AD2B5|nr:ABC transporter permease [Agreia sp. VKM Ac-1783]SMQ60586.1 ABC-2 type transport system permease protein [Agreia sp. VKM Ac-1783]
MSAAEVQARAERIASLPFESIGQTTTFFRGTRSSILDIWSHRELLGLLTRRELKSRYKDSSLGVVWSLVKPLAQLLIYYFAIGQILGAARSVPSFAIFVFIGLTAWGLFTEVVGNGTSSIVGNAGLVKKVYLPREIFPLSTVGGALFNFAVQFIILFAAMVILGEVPLSWTVLYALMGMVVLIVFSTALALLLSAINVYLRDIQHLVDVIILVLFWASPIVYSFSFVHKALQGNLLEQIYLANPITLSVLSMQRGLWVAGQNDVGTVHWPADLDIRLVVALAVSVVLVFLAQRVFSRLQGNFAQEL